MGNSYFNPNINQNNLHPTFEAFLSSTQLGVMLVRGWGKGGVCDRQHGKSQHRLLPLDITEGWILRLKCLPLWQHPTVHEENTRRWHWCVLRSLAL